MLVVPRGPMNISAMRSPVKYTLPVLRSGLIAVQLAGPPKPPPLFVRYTLFVAATSRCGLAWSIRNGAMNSAGSLQAGSAGVWPNRQGPAAWMEAMGLAGSVGLVGGVWRAMAV